MLSPVVAFDAAYTQESVFVTHTDLTEDISITAPDGITVSTNLISLDSAYSEINIVWDGTTQVNGDIVLTSGAQTARIEVITILNNDCFVELPAGVINLIPNPELLSFDNYSAYGPRSIIDVVNYPNDVYCGRTSAKMGNGITPNSNSLDYYFNNQLKPNTSYTSKFMLKTIDGYVLIGVAGVNEPTERFFKTLDTKGDWQEIVYHFNTGDTTNNPMIYINNWETPCKEYYIDNWQIYESYEAPIEQEDKLPGYVPKNRIHSYHSFILDFPYDLYSLNYYNSERIEYSEDRKGTENAAIKHVAENQPRVYLFTYTLYKNFACNTWIKPNSEIALIEEGGISDVNSQNFLIHPEDWGTERMGVGLSVGTNGISVYGHPNNILTSLLTYVAPINDFANVAVNVSTDEVELYVNGELVKTNTLLYPNLTKHMIIFRSHTPAPSYFNGTVDELGTWNRTLTQEEIKKYYINTAPIEVYTNKDIIVNGRDFFLPIHTNLFRDESSVHSYQFDFAYDTTIVEYLGFEQANTLSENSAVLVNNAQKGLLKFASMEEGFYQGDLPLIDLKFKAIKAGYFMPQMSNFLFNVDTENHIVCDTIFVFTKYGDVDGNDHIQAYDASLVLKKSVGLDPLPAIDPLPWEGWRMVAANVDGDDSISAYDASLILQKSIELLEAFPVENNNPTAMTRAATIDFADISISKESDNLVIRSVGNMLGLNMDVVNGNEYLAAPSAYASDFINAENIQAGNYKIGLATATPLEDNSVLMVIPLKNEIPVEMTFNVMVNTTPKTITMLVPAGLSDELIPGVKVFPNPAKDKVTITLGVNPAEQMRYKIVHLSGQTMMEGVLNNQTSVINLPNAAPGLYSIQIMDKDKVIYLQKLIVK